MTIGQSSSDDKRFEGIEHRMENGFRDLRVEMKTGFDRVDARLDSFQRTMILFCGGIIVALIGVVATLAGVIATQL